MLIADDFHCSEQTTLYGRMALNNELEGMWKEANKTQIVVVP
jgi:hypothetical protein